MSKPTPTITPRVDYDVSDIDVFEHAMRGVPLSRLLAAIATFTRNTARLTSGGSAPFKIRIEATA